MGAAFRDDDLTAANGAPALPRGIPGASFALLPDVSHFARLQRPATFTNGILGFLAR